MAAGVRHVCAVQEGGGVSCYKNKATSANLLMAPVGVKFHAVTVGDDFGCGITTAGALRCWGDLPGGLAQLPPESTFFVDVHAGPRHVCGLLPTGIIYCYGDATSRGAINVPSGVVFQGVTGGANYTCGVARNHSVVCWGNGTNPVVAAANTWRAITDAEHVACGADHACYVRVNGSVACWGSNVRGAAAPPAPLATNGSVWWLAAGDGMTCAIAGSSVPGPVTCWGALAGNMTSGYEVACASWGCIATVDAGGDVAQLGINNGIRVEMVAVKGGPPAPLQAGINYGAVANVTTLAGNGGSGKTDGVGILAQFYYPHGVSLDGVGGLYVADTSNYVIRRMDIATRNVSTVAGVAGSSGRDIGVTPLQSKFNSPYGVEVDGAGNVFVADTNNHAIRMLSGAWVAGSTAGVTGASDSAIGTNATFTYPYNVRADVARGVLYVADASKGRIRVVSTSGNRSVTTLASVSAYDIALNPLRQVIYVAGSNVINIVTYAGTVIFLAGGGSGGVDGVGSAASFSSVSY